MLANDELSIKADPHSGNPALVYYDSYPLTPASWQQRKDEVLALRDRAAIAELHAQQPWQLMNWREARALSYRRFFEITGLVGVRVEDEEVFAASHRLI